MVTGMQTPHVFWEEKFFIEPDLGDQRQSTYKALPSPPKTPKRVMLTYRFSGVFPLVLSLAAFVLTLVVVLSGRNMGMFEGQYLLALNTTRLGEDLIRFEKAGIMSTTATAMPSASTGESITANPTSTGGPPRSANADDLRSELNDMLESVSGNLTEMVNEGLGEVINEVVKVAVNATGIRSFYYVYLQKICSASIARGDDANADGVRLDECWSWEDTRYDMSAVSSNMRSSIVVGQTQVSVPLLAKVASALNSILDHLGTVRRVVFAFFIVSLVASILSVVSILPAIYFPQSRLLIYFNIFWAGLATVFAFIAAILLSAVMVLAGVINKFSDTVGVTVTQGGMVLLFVWLSWLFVNSTTAYWTGVWFVETRKWSFVRRSRDEDEIGYWRGIGKEMWRDVKGRRKTLRTRGDI